MTPSVPSDHHRFKVIPQIQKIAEPIYKDTGYIRFFTHARMYDNGFCAETPAHKEWCEHVYKKYMFDHPSQSEVRCRVGINLMKNDKHEIVEEMFNDTRDIFDMDAVITFVARDEVNKAYDGYFFCTNKENADRAYRFYDFHRGKLLNFIGHFKREAKDLIREANAPDNLIEIPGFNADAIENPRRNYAKELFAENKDTKVTSRQTEIAILYAAGFTIADVGKMINVSKSTVHDHLKQFSKQHGIKFERDRRKLKEFVKAKGWEGLEQFFFNFEGLPPLSEAVH